LKRRFFDQKFISLIKSVSLGGSIGVKMNNMESNFFLTEKGLWQGDPLSSILFNYVVDVLTRMMMKAVDRGLIRGLCPELCPGGIISLQYGDDTILFVANEEELVVSPKNTLSCFEQVSGMRINFGKSELIPINMEMKQKLLYIFLIAPWATFPLNT
jgi:hypothetical protein